MGEEYEEGNSCDFTEKFCEHGVMLDGFKDMVVEREGTLKLFLF